MNVLVTTSWDDGHVLDMRLAALLKKYHIRGTFYISPEDREISIEDRLTPESIAALAKDFEIGAHTMTHPRLTDVSISVAEKEIVDSKKYLEDIIGVPVTSFCYPSGYFSKKYTALVKQVGFTFGRTVERFKTNVGTNLLVSPTTLHAYRHWSDAWSILRQVGLVRFWRCYIHWDSLAICIFEQTLETGGVFHLWGHSWEIEKNNDWDRLERVLQYISSHKGSTSSMTNGELAAAVLQKRKTVLFVTPYFLPVGGGLERYAFEIASRLQKEYDWRVVIVTSGEKGAGVSKEVFEGLSVYRLGYHIKVSNTPFSFWWGGMIRTIIAFENPDLINIHMPVPGIGDVAAHVAGTCPVVLTYHAGTMKKGVFIPDILIWLYERVVLPRTIHRAEKVICSSQFVKKTILSSCNDNATVITPAVDTTIFRSSTTIEKKKHEIVFVCNYASMHQLKGLHILVRAISELVSSIPDISLKVIGEKGTSVFPWVHFVGYKKGEELIKEIQAAQVLVLSSLAPAESFGMVLIEAMACKVPVVGTYAGGIPEVINDSVDGFLVQPGDFRSLASAIEQILLNDALAQRMGEAGYAKVHAQFTWEKQVKITNELFRTVV